MMKKFGGCWGRFCRPLPTCPPLASFIEVSDLSYYSNRAHVRPQAIEHPSRYATCFHAKFLTDSADASGNVKIADFGLSVS
jgi:hypothetical protein